jgi:hypothetical protein
LRLRLAAGLLAGLLPATVLAAPAHAATRPCVTWARKGTCGPYPGYRPITGVTGPPSTGNDMWNPIPHATATLTSHSPGRWRVTTRIPAGNTAVVSYPSVAAPYGKAGTTHSTPLGHFTSLRSGFTETMPRRVDAEAAYDIWGGPDRCGSCAWADEVMIQVAFTASRPRCAHYAARARFAGQTWGLCVFGSERIWQLPAGHNEASGTVNIRAMLAWLIAHGRLPKSYGLTEAGFGWEVCSTGGRPATFTVSRFWLHAVT